MLLQCYYTRPENYWARTDGAQSGRHLYCSVTRPAREISGLELRVPGVVYVFVTTLLDLPEKLLGQNIECLKCSILFYIVVTVLLDPPRKLLGQN